MEFMFLDNTLINYMKLERIRSSAYFVDYFVSERFTNQVLNKQLLLVGAFYDKELVGGAFITTESDSLYIDQLFVSANYQRSELHVGSNLMKYILNNKDKIEEYFHKELLLSKLQTSDTLQPFYKKLGYHTGENYMHMIKRI